MYASGGVGWYFEGCGCDRPILYARDEFEAPNENGGH
jgi:hypothetical protein